MNNKIDSDNIDKNTDKSRVYDDKGNRVEDKPTEFSNNLVDFYNNANSDNKISEKALTQEEKKEVVNGLFDNIKNSFLLFFSMKSVENDEEYIKRCKNASTISILFLLVSIFDFLIFKNEDFLNTLINIGCLVVLALAIVALRTGKKNCILFGLIGGILMLLSFRFIKMIFGVLYIWAMICLMNCKEDEKKEGNNMDMK